MKAQNVSRALAAYLLVFGLLCGPGNAELSAQTKEPPSIYIDKGACPFECCTYRDWVARTDATLVSSPGSKTVAGHIKKGEKVLALTGEVHSLPLKAVARDDYPEIGVKAGETVYIINYMGEGYWKIWHNGKIDQIQDLPGSGAKPKMTWWVKLKTSAGAVGWIVEHGNFDNEDACG